MMKPSFVEMAEKDMDFEAGWVIKDICEYAEKNLIDPYFLFETFLKAFRKRINEGGKE